MMSTDNESPRILRVAETASTNSLLRELVIKESLAEGSVVVADFQTAGRGQIGNTWESEAGKNLMFSYSPVPYVHPCEPSVLDFSNSSSKREGGVGLICGSYHREVAERYLLERQEDLRNVD